MVWVAMLMMWSLVDGTAEGEGEGCEPGAEEGVRGVGEDVGDELVHGSVCFLWGLVRGLGLAGPVAGAVLLGSV